MLVFLEKLYFGLYPLSDVSVKIRYGKWICFHPQVPPSFYLRMERDAVSKMFCFRNVR
jgi:hypothetical protein